MTISKQPITNMTRKMYPSLLFILLHLAMLHCCLTLDSKPTGFSLKLTRRNLDELANSSNYFPNVIRPKIARSTSIFTIEASVGTPGTPKNFIFDPGSDLTWTQCTPCIRCFKQNYPLFDPKKSKSYQKLSPNHASARYFRRSENGDFSFYVIYGSGESASGIVSVETFTFPSHKKGYESIKNVVFGCANNQRGHFMKSVTGIMGMNRSPLSMIGQMGSMVKRFSYCLPHIHSPVKTTLLRFGDDIKGISNARSTSFLNHVDYNYRLRLLDISILGQHIKLPANSFPRGMMLDAGCSHSMIESQAYNEILSALKQHYERFNLTRVRGTSIGFNGEELCYRLPRGFRSYPNMAFHFWGADLEIGPENLFRVTVDQFCLAMMESGSTTILGAFQQQNVRFVYDVGVQKLFFGKEDWSLQRA